MARVTIMVGEGDDVVGDFDFDQVPRKGEEISVSMTQAVEDIRIFIVGEVIHVAVGVGAFGFGPGPRTLLRYCEEIH